jgi:hypothetical protein
MKSALRLVLCEPALRDQEAAILDGDKPQGCSILYTFVFGQNFRPTIVVV